LAPAFILVSCSAYLTLKMEWYVPLKCQLCNRTVWFAPIIRGIE
jgi:hypothetical protein